MPHGMGCKFLQPAVRLRYRRAVPPKEPNKRQRLTDSNEEMPTQRRSQGGKQWDIVSQSALKKAAWEKPLPSATWRR